MPQSHLQSISDDPRAPEDAAIAWIARLRAHDVNEGDRRRFAVWLAESPRHQRAFDAMTVLWERLAVVDSIAIEQRAQTPGRARKPWLIPLALAASLLLSLGIWLQASRAADVHETARGAQSHLTLADGSRIDLNTDTRVEIRVDDDLRHVNLTRGEAYFEVSADPGRPFTIETRDGVIRVIGTAFLVRVGADNTLVGVESGRVGVASAGAASEIGAGEAVVMTEGIRRTEIDPSLASSWRSGQLVYDGVTLAELIADLNRYVAVPMSVASAELARERVSAVVTIGEQNAMLDALAESLPLRWRLVSDRLIVIQARGG